MKVIIYYMRGNKRSQAVTTALQAGIARCQGAENILMLDESTYTTPLSADVVCFYGLSGNLMRIFQEYRKKNIQTVFLDLGIWGRKGDPQPDFHRVAINGYQPTSYFSFDATPERFEIFNKTIKPWRNSGSEIIVAGMSERASQVWGLGSATAHAAAMIAEVRKYTDRKIAYRAKPSWTEAVPIEGTRFAMGPLDEELAKAWATVSYRSNVSVDGLIAGVPSFILGDHPSLLMGPSGIETSSQWGITELKPNDLSQIETPNRPDDPERLEFCSRLAWAQYSLRELRNGYAWKELRKHGWLRS